MSTEEQLSLFAGVSPASHSPLPGSKEARKMTAHSGQKCSESYERFSQLGSLARTFLESSKWNSTACYLTWKPKVTPHKRLYFQLAPLMPSTEEIESGLLHTPTAKANQMAPSMNSGWWPTPTTDIGHERTKEYWENRVGKHQIDLQGAVKMWPTPSASQGGAGEFIANLMTKDGDPAKPGERAYNPNTGKHSQISLQRAVKMWPTPRASEWKGGRSFEGLIASGRKASNSLNDALTMQNQQSGALNPEWVEWLMGFPIGHTDLKD